jgi:hypothetical protein
MFMADPSALAWRRIVHVRALGLLSPVHPQSAVRVRLAAEAPVVPRSPAALPCSTYTDPCPCPCLWRPATAVLLHTAICRKLSV